MRQHKMDKYNLKKNSFSLSVAWNIFVLVMLYHSSKFVRTTRNKNKNTFGYNLCKKKLRLNKILENMSDSILKNRRNFYKHFKYFGT